MANLSITATAIIPQSGARLVRLQAASAITQGQSVYQNTSGQWALADADANATVTELIGIATSEVTAATQYVDAIVEGDLAMGSILVANQSYGVSTTTGGILIGSLPASGDYLGLLGIGISTTVLRMHRFISNVVTA